MSDERTRIYMREYMRRYRERGPMQRDRWTEARLTEPYAERKRRTQEASERHD